MANTLRSQVIRLASTFPKGSPERKQLLAALAETSGTDRRMMAGINPKYHNLLSQLVDYVDAIEEPHKNNRAKDLLDDLQEMAAKDPIFDGPDSGKAFGAKQVIDYLQDSIVDAKKAAEKVGWAYDELNKWWSKHAELERRFND